MNCKFYGKFFSATLRFILRYTAQLNLFFVMKFLHLLVAAGICSTSAAQAQTTPTQTPNNPSTLTPSSAAPALNPNSAGNSRDLPATGAPDAIDNTISTNSKRTPKSKKQKTSMSSGNSKVKTKM
jgi:hypothetical protein